MFSECLLDKLSCRSRAAVPVFLNIRASPHFCPQIHIYLSEQTLLPISVNVHLPSVDQAHACPACASLSQGSETLLGLAASPQTRCFLLHLLRCSRLRRSGEHSPALEAGSWEQRVLRSRGLSARATASENAGGERRLPQICSNTSPVKKNLQPVQHT